MTASDPAARKVRPEHLRRLACLYVRQSSPHQVLHNRESRERQYALQARARELGWPRNAIRVIDDDLGKSAADTRLQRRDGFKDLLARISVGEVGIVPGLEVSRLARDNSAWHQMLKLCAFSSTLVLDEDGIYDPCDINDRLVPGLKGTLSEMELHTLRARLLGGARNKARRGELEIALPTGLVLRQDGQVRLDPDASAVSALRLVFATFRRAGTATATSRRLCEDGVLLPRRPRSGPDKGRLAWVTPTCSRVSAILRNPRYAGAYVYGRTGICHEQGRAKRRPLPPDQWQVLLPDAHPGYIDWPEYRRNCKTLDRNVARSSFGGNRVPSPRNGSALLQSRALCGRCGRRLQVRYASAARAGSQACYVCRRHFPASGFGRCLALAAKPIDRAVASHLIATVNREEIGLTLAAQDEISAAAALAASARERQLEGLRYEAGQARRRFLLADPRHRLVAGPLEADWNAALAALQTATREHERLQERDRANLSQRAREQVARIEEDFALLRDAPSTSNADRKRLLALLVEDVTLNRDGYLASAQLRFRGGRSETLAAELPRPVHQVRKVSRDTLDALDRLLATCTDGEAAAELNRQGRTTGNGAPFHARNVRHLRRYHDLPSLAERLAERGFLSASAMARKLGIAVATVRQRYYQGRLQRQRYTDGQRPKHLYTTALPDERPSVTETSCQSGDRNRPEQTDSEARQSLERD